MEDDAPVIYGLEFQARTLAAQVAETDVVRFFVGTQSLRYENQVHQLQFDEEHNLVNKNVFLHKAGEVWHLSTSTSDPEVIATCYNQITPEGKCVSGCSLWRLPATVQLNDSSPSDDSVFLPSLEQITKFDSKGQGSDFKSCIWQPLDGKQVITLLENEVLYWDIAGSSEPKLIGSMAGDPKGKLKLSSARWNPHQSCMSVGTAIDNAVKGWDLRTMQPSWSIENAHSQTVRELDFNPNRQYYLATCADDCQAKFWDIRNPSKSVLSLSHHSHWIWSVRYNHFHDQLLLTCSSDSRVVLSRVASISSEPFGHLLEEEEGLSSADNEPESRPVQQDGVITTYEEHEDSVYAVEWSSADPWLFASLSYDGRLVINRVPRAEKYKILL